MAFIRPQMWPDSDIDFGEYISFISSI